MNPFQAIMGRMGCQMPQNMSPAQQMGNGQAMDWNALMGQLQANPGAVLKEANYNVPDEIANDPQAAALYILRSGQASNNPMMRIIAPMLNRMGVR